LQGEFYFDRYAAKGFSYFACGSYKIEERAEALALSLPKHRFALSFGYFLTKKK